jgi:hypothetical protein
VVLGQRGLILFSSLDRLVAFLRAYSEEGSLDELVPSLQIRRLVTPLRTHELMLSAYAESSYRMDRLAGIARLTGGLVFTGTQRHFVKYRDAAAPLGYDVQQLVDEPADLVLYHDSFRQTYSYERELSFRNLVLKLTPQRLAPSERTVPARLLATAELGVGHALISYLYRFRIAVVAAAVEWPPESAFEDRPRRRFLFKMSDVPERVVGLLGSLPGVHLFEPLGEGLGVELGYRHPVALETCTSLFEKQSLYLFQGDGEVLQVDPLPPFAPLRSLVRIDAGELEEPAAVPEGSEASAAGLSLSLRLVPSQDPWRSVVASVIDKSQREWLARLLYALPGDALSSLRIAETEDSFYLICATGIEGVPLGSFYREVATRIYIPAGFAIVPAVAPSVLEELVRGDQEGHVFFSADGSSPRLVPSTAFGPVSRRALRRIGAVTVHSERPLDADPPLPALEYGKARALPLFRAAGKPTSKDEPAGGGRS